MNRILIFLTLFSLVSYSATHSDPSKFDFLAFHPCTPLHATLNPNLFPNDPQKNLHLVNIAEKDSIKPLPLQQIHITSCSANFATAAAGFTADKIAITKYLLNNNPLPTATIIYLLNQKSPIFQQATLEINGIVVTSFSQNANMLNVNTINYRYDIVFPGVLFSLESENDITEKRKDVFNQYVDDSISQN